MLKLGHYTLADANSSEHVFHRIVMVTLFPDHELVIEFRRLSGNVVDATACMAFPMFRQDRAVEKINDSVARQNIAPAITAQIEDVTLQTIRFHAEVVHSATLVERLTRGMSMPGADTVTYHDPCYLGRYADTHEEPRELLGRFGARVAEPVRTRDNPFCCGAGGGLLFEEHESGKRISQERFEQLQATGARTVVMACPFCSIMRKGAQASANADLEMTDLMSYVDARMKAASHATPPAGPASAS